MSSDRRPRAIPVPFFECLEDRRLLSVSLGAVSGQVTEPVPAGGSQVYTFTLARAGEIYAAAPAGNLSLLNGASAALASGSKLLPFRAEPAGTYSLKITSGKGPVSIITESTGQTPATARKLGALDNASATVTGYVGPQYAVNYYAFTFATTNTVTVTLANATSGGAEVAITNSKGTALYVGGASGIISRFLSAGTYYVRVMQTLPGSSSNYTLNVRGKIHLPAPVIQSIVGPASGSYSAGQTLYFTVNFSQPVNVVGAPKLQLTLGGNTVLASYSGGTGTAALHFAYAIQSGDQASGITIVSPIIDIGGAIRNSQLTAAIVQFKNVLLPAVQIGGVAPAVLLAAGPAAGTYGVGATLSFAFLFSSKVTVTGSPEVALNLGGATQYATYASGSGTSTLVFTYTVQAGDNSLAISSPILLNGGTISDAVTTIPASLAFSPPSTGGVVIDTTPATILSITRPADGTYGVGDTLTYTFTFSKLVYVTGIPQVQLNLDSGPVFASYVSGSGSSTLTFAYTLQQADQAVAGVAELTPILLNGGSLRDAAGNAATLSFNPGLFDINVIVDDTINLLVTPVGQQDISGNQNAGFDLTGFYQADGVTPYARTFQISQTNFNGELITGAAAPAVSVLSSDAAVLSNGTAGPKAGQFTLTPQTYDPAVVTNMELTVSAGTASISIPLDFTAVNAPRVYVVEHDDNGGGTIAVFDEQGHPLTLSGSFPNLDGATGVVYDPRNGNTYVTNENNSTITVYDANGNQLTTSGAFPSLSYPLGIALDPQTGLLYVGNYSGGADGDTQGITVYDEQGNLISVTGNWHEHTGDAPTLPYGLLVDDRNQRLYVADNNFNRVEIYDLQGNNVGFFNTHDGAAGLAQNPVTGLIYVADDSQSVNIYTEQGTEIYAASAGSLVTGSALKFSNVDAPFGLAFDSATNNLYVTNYSDGEVTQYDTFGNQLFPSASGFGDGIAGDTGPLTNPVAVAVVL